jgi:hypothetical protein
MRCAVIERHQPRISGIERNGIVAVMKIPELPVLHAVKLSKTTRVKFDPGIQKLERLHAITIGIFHCGIHILIRFLQLSLSIMKLSLNCLELGTKILDISMKGSKL